MRADVCVIGAGIVGVAAALELQQRGVSVSLVDRETPGSATSFGNAGVLSASAVLNVNNPNLFANLLNLVLCQLPYVRYDIRYAISKIPWVLDFLRFGTLKHVHRIAHALHDLQSISISRHRDQISAANAGRIFQEDGWLKVYRDEKAYGSTALERELMDTLDIDYVVLSRDDLQALEPALKPVYEVGLLLPQTCSVSSPLMLTSSYFDLFKSIGGRFVQAEINGVRRASENGWSISLSDSGAIQAKEVIIATGPWAPDICKLLGYKIPMAWERGYHMNLKSPPRILRRPVCDVQSGFVMAPQGRTTRITSGVEFAHRDAQPDYRQVHRAVADARGVVAFGDPVDQIPWLGARPTLPDGLPMIGRACSHEGLWFNFGHQHIGLGTSTGSAALLADMITGNATVDIDNEAYSPARFGA